jgi:hypothetical protein
MGGRVLLAFRCVGSPTDDLVVPNDESPDWNLAIGGGKTSFL